MSFCNKTDNCSLGYEDIKMKDFTIDSNDSLHLVIDIQEKLFKVMPDFIQDTLKKNCGILIKTSAEFNIPVIITEQYKKGLGETIPELKEITNNALNLEKIYFDCMKDDMIKKAVITSGKKTIIISGIESHICVFQTAVSLINNGFKVIIASDGVASRRLEDRNMALRMLTETGVLIYPTETIAFMILEKSGTPEFKKLSPLFK